MSATLNEVLMGLGSFAFDCDSDPELVAELVKGPNGERRDGRGLLLYQGEQLVYGGPKIADTPGREAVSIRGVSPEWYLGDGEIGPTEVDHLYIAGNNKLANPIFRYLFDEAAKDSEGNDTTRTAADAWKLAETTGWVITSGKATSTVLFPDLVTDPDFALPNDVLTSDESFEAAAGALFRATVRAARTSGTIGRLLLRLIFEGFFRHPNLLPDFNGGWTFDPANAVGDAAFVTAGGVKRLRIGPITQETRSLTGWTDTSEFTGDVSIGGSITVGPCTQPQYLVTNNDFESGDFTNWVTSPDEGGVPHWVVTNSFTSGGTPVTIDPYSGSYMAWAFDDPTLSDHVVWAESLDWVTVKVGERYRLSGAIAEAPVTKGSAQLFIVPIPHSGLLYRVGAPAIFGSNALADNAHAFVWKGVQLEYTVSDPNVDKIAALVSVSFDPATGGSFFFDDITLTRIRGNTCQAQAASFSVVENDHYSVRAMATADAAMTLGELTMTVVLTGSGKPDQTYKSNRVTQDNKDATSFSVELDVPEGYTDAQAYLNGRDIIGAGFSVALPIQVVRTRGNTAKLTAAAESIIGEEEYLLTAPVAIAEGITAGDCGFQLKYSGPGRPDQVIDGPSLDGSDTTQKLLQFPFAAPSGYDNVVATIVGRDILGAGGFTVGPPTLRLLDNKRSVAQLARSSTPSSTSTLDATAPAGSVSVRLEVADEDKGNGWEVYEVSLARAETPVTAGELVEGLVVDPLSGRQLLDVGTVVGPERISWDYHARNLTRRAELQHVSRSGLASPAREWRIYVDPVTGRPTIDWGTPDEISEDRTDLILVTHSAKIITPPAVERDASGRVTHLRLVGADRQRPDGPPIQITGEATNPNEDFLDWDGEPLNRTQTALEPSADHIDYAGMLARYKADQVATPAENIRLQISDWRAWLEKGPPHVGDWIYVYLPEEGIEDPANVMFDPETGVVVFPRQLRIISWTWRLGAGDFRIEVHRPGQANWVVPFEWVHWESDTTLELELGDPLPEYEQDAEGGPALDQLRRFRSMPRT